MQVHLTERAIKHIETKLDELKQMYPEKAYAIGIYSSTLRSWGNTYLTVEASFNIKTKFNGEFKEISNYNGFPILIEPEAEELLQRDELKIDETGWYFYKRLIVENSPLIPKSGGAYCGM